MVSGVQEKATMTSAEKIFMLYLVRSALAICTSDILGRQEYDGDRDHIVHPACKLPLNIVSNSTHTNVSDSEWTPIHCPIKGTKAEIDLQGS
jgi:hypothetical protein